ncbi:MAG: protein kinase [Chloroflexi bacterium]|nr:protein kinase [Chloroflexota bacterium]
MPAKPTCPTCGNPNAPDAERCAQCGASLVVTCPTCGARRPWHVPRCPNCEGRAASGEEVFAALFRQAPERKVGGRYLLGTVLSSSRISTVYRAVDAERPQAPIVVKELSTMAMFRPAERRELDARFHAAVNRWRQASHPALPRITDVFSAGDRYYVVSEFVGGWSLARVVEERRVRVTPRLAANWGAQLCELLAYLHESTPPLYATFLAPRHVLVDADGRVHLVDNGLTGLFLPSAYEAYGGVTGYSAPELRAGAPSPQSDAFALGRLLYAILVGRLLEKGLPRNLPLQQAVPDAPIGLVRAIARAAHRDPAERYASLREMRAELWTEMDGPLEPIAGWSYQAREAAPAPAQPLPARPAAAPGQPGMAAFGFERDARFGPAQAPRGRSASAARPAAGSAAPPPPSARLSVQPRHARLLDLGASETRRVVLTLHNPGPVDVEGRITSHVDWISAPGKAFRLPANRQAKAIISVLGGRLDPGQVSEPQAVSIDTNAGRVWVAVTAEVPSGPSLQVEPLLLDFGEVEGEGERVLPLTLVNDGRQALAGRISPQVEWLRVARPEFRCPAQGQVQVSVTLLPERLPPGEQTPPVALLVDSDAGQERVAARAWAKRPALAMEATLIDLGDLLVGKTGEGRAMVGNRGDGRLEGSARSLAPWLQVQPRQFACEPGESLQLTLSADTAGLAEGPISLAEAVRIYTNAGARSLSVRLTVLAPRMLLNTTQVFFGEVAYGERQERRLRVQNVGTAPLEASLQPLVSWLSVGEADIVVPASGEQTVTLTADTSPFDHGALVVDQPVLRITAGTMLQDVTASLTVLRPLLRVEPEVLDFGYSDPTQPAVRTLTIANDGTGTMAWNVQSDATWAEFEPHRGVCKAGEEVQVRATAYGLALEEGVESAQATLVVSSDAGREKVPLRFAVASPRLACDATFIDLGESVNRAPAAGSFRVFNYGLGLLRGAVRSDETWLVVDRASFECETGRSVEIRVSTDMDEFPPEASYAQGYIHLESNGGSAEVQAVVTVLLEPDVRGPAEGVVLGPSRGGEGLAGRLALRNEGLATARMELLPSAPQIVLARTFCDIKPGKRVRVAVQWEGTAPSAAEEYYIEARAQDGATLRVPVIIGEPGAADAPVEEQGTAGS